LALLDRRALTWALLHTEELTARSSKGEATDKLDHESHHTRLTTFMVFSQGTASSSIGRPVGHKGGKHSSKGRLDMISVFFYPSRIATKPLYLSSCSARVYLDDCNVFSWLDDSKSLTVQTVQKNEPPDIHIQNTSSTHLATSLA
jgi:hypothetical protein